MKKGLNVSSHTWKHDGWQFGIELFFDIHGAAEVSIYVWKTIWMVTYIWRKKYV